MKVSKRQFERACRDFGRYMFDSWSFSVALAEHSVARPSNDPNDLNRRQEFIFDLARLYFDHITLDFYDYLSFLMENRKRRRKRHGRTR